MQLKRALRVGLSCLLFLGQTGLAQATLFYVDAAGGNDGNDCLSSGTACQTITQALVLANAEPSPPHEVHVAAGTYDDVGNGETFPLEPGDGVSLISDGDPTDTFIQNANFVAPIIRYDANLADPSNTVLTGFSLTNANGGAGADVILISPQTAGDNISPVISSNVMSAMGRIAIHINGAIASAVVAPRIRNNNIDNSSQGILAEGNGAFLASIDSNTFSSNNPDGIRLSPPGAGDVCSPLIANNAIVGAGSTFNGIFLDNNGNTASPVIASNTITGTRSYGILLTMQGTPAAVSPQVFNNHLSAPTSGSGITFQVASINFAVVGGISTATFSSNTVSGFPGTGLAVTSDGAGTSSLAITISSNSILNNTGNGIEISGGGGDEFSLGITTNLISGGGAKGIYVNGGIGLFRAVIDRNSIDGPANTGIELAPTGGNDFSPRIASNTITAPGGNGIYIYPSGGSSSSPLIANNTITGSSWDSIYVYANGGAASPAILNNTISGSGQGSLKFYGYSAAFSSATISGNNLNQGSEGLYIYGDFEPFNGVIDSNTFDTNGSNAIYLGPSVSGSDISPRITNNTIVNANSDGVYIYAQNTVTASPVISNNTISASGQDAIYFYTYGTATVSPMIANNTISGAQDGIILRSYYGGTISSATITGNTISGNGLNNATIGLALEAYDGTDEYSILVASNLITGSGEGIFASDYGGAGVSPVLRNNTVTGSVDIGMHLYAYGTSTFLVSSNTVSGSTNTGLRVKPGDSSSPVLTRNSVTGNGGFGIEVYGISGGSSATVDANTMTGNLNSGLYFAGNFSASSPPEIRNNWIVGNSLSSSLAEFQIVQGGGGENSPRVSSNTVISGGSGNKALTIAWNSNADLGGGALGSVGHNTFYGKGGSVDLDAANAANPIIAEYNWWSATPPGASEITPGAGVTVTTAMAQNLQFNLSPAAGTANFAAAVTISTSGADTAFVDNIGSTSTRLTVTVGGLPATGISVSADGLSLTLTTPAGLAGTQTVTVRNPSGQSGSSQFVFGSAPGSAPVGLSGAALGVSSITWSWTALGGATSYKFYPSTGGAAIAAAGTTLTQTWLSTNTAYGGQISAVNAAGEGPLSSYATSYTLAAAPTSFAMVAATTFSATASWAANDNPAGTSYRLFASTPSLPVLSSVTVTGLSAEVAGLAIGSPYTLTLSAFNGDWIATSAGVALSTATAGTAPQSSALPSGGGTVTLNPPTGAVAIDIPAGALPAGVNVTLSVPSPETLFAAPAGGDLQGTGVAIEINLDQAVQPSAPVLLNVGFRDSDVAGKNKDQLTLARFDAERRAWVPLISSVNKATNKVTGRTRHFSIFQIMVSVPAVDLNSVRVIPNPFRPNQGHVGVGFFNLPAFARLRIYTYAGEVVRDVTANAAGLATWDGNNESGRAVASGVYVVYAQGAGGSRTFKVAVQR